MQNNEIGNTIDSMVDSKTDSLTEAQQKTLLRERTTSWNQTIVDVLFFATRHLAPDGSYDLARQLGEREADDASRKDFDSDSHFSNADRMRSKSKLMVGMLIFMASSLWFYTLANEIRHRIRFSFAIIGFLLMLAGIAGTVVIEVL